MSVVSSCRCMENEEGVDPLLKCHCNIESDALSWKWCTKDVCPSVILTEDARVVVFHERYSSGTAVARGDTPFVYNNHYYWEVEMLTRLYGTDIMVGVGTQNMEFDESRYNFYSLLGRDEESWGFSYKGTIQHAGKTYKYGKSFSIGDVVGVHLDTWKGTLEFYLNRKPLGIAFSGLKWNKVLYPMVCSTAAQSMMKLVYAVTQPASLMLHCARFLSHQPESMKMMQSIPGLRNMFDEQFWLLLPSLGLSNCDNSDDEDMPCTGKLFKNSSIFGKGSTAFKQNRNSSQHVYDGGTNKRITDDSTCLSLDEPMNFSGHRAMAWGEFPEDNHTTSIVKTLEDESSVVYADLNEDDDCSEEEWPKSSQLSDAETSAAAQSSNLTAGFTAPLCQICDLRPAVTLKSLHTTAKKCLQCFHKT